MARVDREGMLRAMAAVLGNCGVPAEAAEVCSRIVTESTMDGVFSHGINKVPSLVQMIRDGHVKPAAAPLRVGGSGAVERWDGGGGLGIYNAFRCTRRACELARTHGVGCVGLRNTNHWFRAGSYGLQAAREGYAFMAWTNTTPNMPPWGGREPTVGNNPLVLAAPGPGQPVVLDMAMSQVSLGKLHLTAARGEMVDVPCGFDAEGELTADPRRILSGGRVLPTGFHKGSGLALLLDILAVLLSGGHATHTLGEMDVEHDVSQVFVAFEVEPGSETAVGRILEAFHDTPSLPGMRVLHPGEGSLERRRRAETEGCEVDDEVWARITALQG